MQHSDIIQLWLKNKTKIRNFIRQRIKGTHDVEDILQEVFIILWTDNKKIRMRDKILPWLYGITRNTIADYYRKKESSTPLDYVENEIPAETETPGNTGDESKKLLPLIYSLPSKYKTALLMSDIYGEPHKEIAQQFDLSVSCIKSRVVRGRKLLTQKMHECCSFSHDKYGNIVYCEEKQAYFDCLENLKKHRK
jgi:RNA polymerase sigma-70 factor, ECF subfamily